MNPNLTGVREKSENLEEKNSSEEIPRITQVSDSFPPKKGFDSFNMVHL
jgi:hypothetical protein